MTEWQYLTQDIKCDGVEILKESTFLVPTKTVEGGYAEVTVSGVEIKIRKLEERFFLQRTLYGNPGEDIFCVSEYSTGQVVDSASSIMDALNGAFIILSDAGRIQKMRDKINYGDTKKLNA